MNNLSLYGDICTEGRAPGVRPDSSENPEPDAPAHAEGLEERTHDTAGGAAQRELNELQQFLKTRISEEIEACAQLELKRADLQLLSGEMSAQEVRTVQPVLTTGLR